MTAWERACWHYASEHAGRHVRMLIGDRRTFEATSGRSEDHVFLIVSYLREGELVDEHFEWDLAGNLQFHAEPIDREQL